MAYAGDIINDSFNKTKVLFFPIRAKYWFKMGFVNLMAGNSQGGSYNGSNSSGKSLPADMTLKEFIASLNSKALAFLSQYGYFVGIGIIVLYCLGLIFSYLASVFTFVFIDGILKKDITIGKSFSECKKQGASLFKLRFIVGLISLAITAAIFSPVLAAFFANTLAEFNFWLLIPMFIGVIVLSIPLGIFFFLVEDFTVPIMYTKKCGFGDAWNEFKKIASEKKGEIFLYWLIKIGLGIIAGLGSFIIALIVMLPAIAIAFLGILLYYVLNTMAGQIVALIIVALLAILLVSALSYLIAVVLVPVSVFFRIYSIEMVKKLQEGKK